jgi:hypothetical protein
MYDEKMTPKYSKYNLYLLFWLDIIPYVNGCPLLILLGSVGVCAVQDHSFLDEAGANKCP